MKYKVGDYVRIRSWNAMCESAGCDPEDTCEIEFGDNELMFVEDMKDFCGHVAQVKDIRHLDIGNMHQNYYILDFRDPTIYERTRIDGGGFKYTDNMLNDPYKVGDKVKIREWDDMMEQYGGDAIGIDCRGIFVDNMKQYCGKTYQINTVSKYLLYTLFGADNWTFSADMFDLSYTDNSPEVPVLSFDDMMCL